LSIDTHSRTRLRPAGGLARPLRWAALSGGAAARWLGDGSLTKKAYLNALTEALDYGARLAVGFLITPLLVAGLGSYQYGLWQILSRLIDYVSAASGRPTQALKWVIARRRSATDEQEKRHYVGSAVVVWVLFLPLLVTLGGLVAWWAPVWLGTSEAVSSTVRLAAALLVAYVILTGLADIPQAVIEGENLRYKRMALSAALVLVGGGLTALAVLLDGGLVGVAVANLAYPLLSGLLFLKIVRTYAPWFRVVLPSRAEVRAFFGLSCWFLLWRLVNLLLMASDVLVLGKLGSVEAVSTYTLTKYSPETLISMIAIVVYGISPGLGGIVGSGDLPKAARVRGEIMVGTWLLAIAIGATIVIWNHAFVGLWVGPEHYAGAVPTLLIMLTVVQLVLIRNDANVIDLSLDLRTKVLLGALSAGTSVALAALLVGSLGLGVPGLCVGFLAGRSILSLGYPWQVGRLLKIPARSQLRGVPRPAIATVALFGLALLVGGQVQVESWSGLIAAVSATFAAASVLAFYVGLSARQRGQLWRRVQLAIRPTASG
jgi:O-antigen/teichoic acid export membrane protein